MRFVVRDDVFCQPYNGIETWQGDCVQVAFAAREVEGSANRLAHTRQLGYSEYTLALTPRGPELYRTITFDGIRFPKALADSDVFPLKIRRAFVCHGRDDRILGGIPVGGSAGKAATRRAARLEFYHQ